MSGHQDDVPIWVCPCTHMGPPTHPHGYARVPRWVCPHTQMGTPVHPDGSAPAPLGVHARIRQIHRHTKLVTPACLPDSPAHQACHPAMSARFTGTPSLSSAQNCQFPGHSAPLAPFSWTEAPETRFSTLLGRGFIESGRSDRTSKWWHPLPGAPVRLKVKGSNHDSISNSRRGSGLSTHALFGLVRSC